MTQVMSIKKILILQYVFFLFGSIHTFAQENSTTEVLFRENISLALLWRMHGLDEGKSGGSIELGFPIIKSKKYFLMRGYVTFEIAGGHRSDYGFLTLAGGTKFQFGGKIDRGGFRFVTYGYFAPQFGGALSRDTNFGGKPPIYLELAGGGGFEFFFLPTSSFFIEYGGGCYIPFGEFEQRAGTMFTVGHRRFFN